MTGKSLLEKKEKYQRAKVKQALKEITHEEKRNRKVIEGLMGKEVVNAVYGNKNTVVLEGPNVDLIPNFAPFYEKIFLTICPGCRVVQSPSRLLPFLELGLVVPVLSSPLHSYSENFIGSIAPFVHIPFAYYDFLAWLRLFQHEEEYVKAHVCSHCFDKAYKALERIPF